MNQRLSHKFGLLTQKPARVKIKSALVDMHAELKILCSECGAMNTVNVDPSFHVQTAFCRDFGAELHLILQRSRPASFAPL
jgi:hypothetical protein